ncbi:GNAT family N-acetyltransferase [Marinobacter zhanjiangensis]|uniref:N-acetyltransferase n=1 Tax=Marinobacter zhanjiangensis TaxID=578215 RepID=A0ABQ3ALI0_9GAMM|nr:GNAT family protein [Marinobacter zhanjiangensis]GGY61024.1 N-acetyltransferase [Marinobacter zhanjiangensis]
MVFQITQPVLEGQHVRLEPLSEDHVDGLFEIGQRQDDWAYMPTGAFTSRSEAQQWVQQALDFARKELHYTYVLVEPSTGALMGSTRYLNIRARDHVLEIGYTWLGRDYQRTAVNTEAKYLLLRHAFEVLGAFRVELKTDARNQRSQKAIERLGAQKEGVLRRHMVVQDGFVRDSVMYGITDLDWPDVRDGLLKKLG